MDALAVGRLLGLWNETAGGAATLINLSENHTFRIDLPGGRRYVLRAHRPGNQSATAIDSELEWLASLRAETDLPVPTPLRGSDGRLVQNLALAGEAPRHAVLFAFEPGVEPTLRDDLGDLFATLGRFAAIAHTQSSRFVPSPRFTRGAWGIADILDSDGRWGDWRTAPQVEGAIVGVLTALDQRLRSDLAAYGQARDRFGLIHADMRLANLLIDGDRVTLIDFDDCGFGWFMYDFAAAISFYENDAQAPELRRRWLGGYGAVRELTPEDIDILDAMVLLRRMALLAWIGSHGETGLAQSHADDFARVTAELAMPYLAR